MKEFLLNQGWMYTGSCNCSPKYDYYRSESHPEFEIGLSTNNGFRIRKGKIKNTVSQGGSLQFENTYNQIFNN